MAAFRASSYFQNQCLGVNSQHYPQKLDVFSNFMWLQTSPPESHKADNQPASTQLCFLVVSQAMTDVYACNAPALSKNNSLSPLSNVRNPFTSSDHFFPHNIKKTVWIFLVTLYLLIFEIHIFFNRLNIKFQTRLNLLNLKWNKLITKLNLFPVKPDFLGWLKWDHLLAMLSELMSEISNFFFLLICYILDKNFGSKTRTMLIQADCFPTYQKLWSLFSAVIWKVNISINTQSVFLLEAGLYLKLLYIDPFQQVFLFLSWHFDQCNLFQVSVIFGNLGISGEIFIWFKVECHYYNNEFVLLFFRNFQTVKSYLCFFHWASGHFCITWFREELNAQSNELWPQSYIA